jgi:hypothetical protein
VTKEATEISAGKLSGRLFELEPRIRYVAVNQSGRIVQMEQSPRHPSFNPDDTDRMEELLVNPIVLELTSRRGNLDLGGVQYVVIRYGAQYQLVMPYGDGHLSVGIDHKDDPLEIAREIAGYLEADKTPRT